MSQLTEKITQLLDGKFVDTDYFLVNIKAATNNQKVQIFIDGDTGMTSDYCAEVSRYLEPILEEQQLVPEKYTLEVSSPGLDNPFKVARQYKKSIGKLVVVKLSNGSKKEGLLHSFDETNLVLEQYKVAKNKQKKDPLIQQITIPFSNIKSTKEKIVF